MKRCNYYFDLEPIMADRAKAHPKCTTDTLDLVTGDDDDDDDDDDDISSISSETSKQDNSKSETSKGTDGISKTTPTSARKRSLINSSQKNKAARKARDNDNPSNINKT